MTKNNKLKMTFGYKDTDFTRVYTVNGIDDSDVDGIKEKIKAVNASLEGGTADGLNAFFRSDDFDAENSVGTFTKITHAQLESTETIDIPIADEETAEEDENNG